MAFGGDRGTSGRGFFAAGIALLLATPAAAGLIPGGGSVKADCYVEFNVQGASGSNVVTCTDGDPACDDDGQCDGTCTFRIALCPNQTDASVPGCTPSSLTAQPIVKGATLNPVPDLAGSACGAAANVSVSTKKGGTKKGKATVHVKATATNGKPKKDTDKLVLICLPRTGTCPPPTTTTVPATTTTTESTSTTEAPPSTTTTTAAVTTTTGASTTSTTEATTTTTAASTTSTTESTTTTTTAAPVCGDNIIEPGETCDPPGTLACPDPDSPGAFLACRDDCRCPGEPTTTTTTTEASTTTTTEESTTTTTASTTTTTLPTLLSFTTVPGTTSCGGAAFSPAAAAPLSGELDSDTGCSTKINDLGRGCLYFGGGKATIVPPGLIPDGATSKFSVTGPGTLGGNAGTGPKDCTNGSGPGKHCVNGWCNSDADCNGTAGSCAAGLPPGNCAPGTQNAALSCSVDGDCGGSATSCRPDANCFFGPPLPIPSPPPNDALTTCVQNVVDTTATGTFDAATGDSNVTLPLGSRVYITGNSTDPCPRCISGTCDATWVDVNGNSGEDNGKACTTDGVVVDTSLDCRPPLAGYQANLPVNLSPLTTGTASMTNGTGQFCPSQTVANAGAFGKLTARCIQETGLAAGDLSDGNPHQSIIASVFCIPKTGNVAVDGVAALPGPGAIAINGTVQTQ